MHRLFCAHAFALVLLLAAPVVAAQDGWFVQNSPSTAPLLGVDFVDADTGWICGMYGTILHTTDGGETWTEQVSNTAYSLRSISFSSASHGLAVGEGGTILKTTDGGATWVVVRTDWMDTLYGVHALDESLAWVVGKNAIFAPFVGRSSDGGSSWSFSTFYIQNNEATLTDVVFVSPTVGFTSAAIWDGRGAVCRTTNGGASWTTQTIIPDALYTIDMASEMMGLAGGLGGATARTIDGGTTWTSGYVGTGQTVYGLNLPSESVGFVVGDAGMIARTDDGGLSWTQQTSGTGITLGAVDFVDLMVGTTVGDAGTILRTETGGLPGSGVASGESAPVRLRMLASAPNPFHLTTQVELESDGSEPIRVDVFDLMGRRVHGHLASIQSSGRCSWTWDGTDHQGRPVAPGAYLLRARLASGGASVARRVVFLGP